MPIAKPLRVKAITEIPAQKNNFWESGNWSILDENQIRGTEITREIDVAKKYLTNTTRFKPSGDKPTIQSRLPSRENCGKTNRVVKVAKFNAHAARFIKLTSFEK